MRTQNPKKDHGDRPQDDARRSEMLAAGDVMDRFRGHGDQGGRWLWRDRWADA